jgi:hypothetical protein
VILLESELNNADLQCAAAMAATIQTALIHGAGRLRSPRCAMNATEVFNAGMGFDALALGTGDDADIMDGVMDGMIDGLSVFEVNSLIYDLVAAKHTSRLGHPVLLVIRLMPNRLGQRQL